MARGWQINDFEFSNLHCVIKKGMAQDFSHASFFPNSLSNVNTDAFSVRLYPKIPLDF